VVTLTPVAGADKESAYGTGLFDYAPRASDAGEATFNI
jgi:hypothetical protein